MDHYNIKVSKKDYRQELSSGKKLFCEISHIATFARILVFNPKKKIGKLCSCFYLISLGIITISKIHKKFAVTAICKRNCNLRNFAFYKFSQNLGCPPFEKDLTTLQLLQIVLEIIIISNFVGKATARALFRKIRILRNFVFYNFC